MEQTPYYVKEISQRGSSLIIKINIDPDYENAYDDTVRLFNDDESYVRNMAVKDGEKLEKGVSTLTFEDIIPNKKYSAEVDQGVYEYGEPGGKYFLFTDITFPLEEGKRGQEIETIYPSFKLVENGEPAKYVFFYLDLPRTGGFKLEFSFVTDDKGRIGTLEIPDRSVILRKGEEYNLFYDFRPWTEKELGTLKESDCQKIVVEPEIQLDPKKGDIEIELQDVDGTKLDKRIYRLHFSDGTVRDGLTDANGILNETNIPDGIVRLEMYTTKKTVLEEGEDVKYEVYEYSSSKNGTIDDDEELTFEEPNDEVLDVFMEFEKGWDELQKSLTEVESSLPTLTEEITFVDTGWLQEAKVILCRGKRYTVRIIFDWSRPWRSDFKHWTLMQTLDVEEDGDDSMALRFQSWHQFKKS